MEKIPYKIYLSEDEMPKCWYNVKAVMKELPDPFLHPGTLQPMTADELKPIFCDELVDQEMTPRMSISPSRRGSMTTTGCTGPHPWSGLTTWRNSWGLRPRSTLSSRATTPQDPIS